MPLSLFSQIEELIREIDIAGAQCNPSYLLFLSHVKHDIAKLNRLIVGYNTAESPENAAIISIVHEFYKK